MNKAIFIAHYLHVRKTPFLTWIHKTQKNPSLEMITAKDMKTLILIFSLALSITSVQCQTNACRESYKIDNQVCIDDIYAFNDVEEVLSQFSDIEFKQTYIEAIVGDRIILEAEGIKIYYEVHGPPSKFYMSLMDITSNQHYLYDTVNEVELRIGQQKTKKISQSQISKSKEFSFYNTQTDDNNIITKIRVSFRNT